MFIWQVLWKDVPGHGHSDAPVNCVFAFLLSLSFHLQRRLLPSSNQCGKGPPANPCNLWPCLDFNLQSHQRGVCVEFIKDFCHCLKVMVALFLLDCGGLWLTS